MIDGHIDSIENVTAGISEKGKLAATLSSPKSISCSLSQREQCSGSVNGTVSIKGLLSPKQTLSARLNEPEQRHHDTYEGPYDVIPKSYQQQFGTFHKLMSNDMTVRKIPYYETSNQTGTTVYIGG